VPISLQKSAMDRTGNADIEHSYMQYVVLIVLTCRWARLDVSVTVCGLVFCVFVRLWISPPRIKLAASHFARRFIGVHGRESPILGNFAPPEAQNWTNRPARHHLHEVHNDCP